ncbi:C2H2-type domain-containing protein [Psidium guajava]|nr:C2H2-type domain-containing protein [Psidium guajava]
MGRFCTSSGFFFLPLTQRYLSPDIKIWRNGESWKISTNLHLKLKSGNSA